MSDIITVEPLNEVHMKIIAEASVKTELAEHFSFRPEGYQFNPRFKARVWDGIIRLFSPFKPVLYNGLLTHLQEFCDARGYTLNIPEKWKDEPVEDDYVLELAKEINCKFTPRDYQIEYIKNSIY